MSAQHCLVAVSRDDSTFTFDNQLIVDALTEHWPGTSLQDQPAPLAQIIELPPDIAYASEIHLFDPPRAVSIYLNAQDLVAEVVSIICRVHEIPSDDSVQLMFWTEDDIALHRGITKAELMHLAGS